MTPTRALDREIGRLAVPAFLALVAEPLFLLADSAIVGHLGTVPLAGLALASVVLRAVVGLCIFLAYGTTASVARRVGAGDERGALELGVDGLWLALLLGAAGALAGTAAGPVVLAGFGATREVTDAASTYLVISWAGLPALLASLAATGVLRGLSQTRTPLVVAVAANVANVVANLLLVYAADLGIAGSALGTVTVQWLAAAALVLPVSRHASAAGASLGLRPAGVRAVGRAGGALVVRTISLQVALATTTWCAADLGPAATAAHQVANAVWTFLAFALDAVAIAAQTLTGRALGAGDLPLVRRTTDRIIRIGLVSGVVTGVLLALAAPLVGRLFTDDAAVVDRLTGVLLVAALFQPVAGVVFVLDGILIGAGDGRYLAIAGTVVTVLFVPVVVALTQVEQTRSLLVVWLAFGAVFISGRAVVLVARARGDRWLVPGPVGADRR